MSAAERTVRVGLMTYQREDGRFRLAYAGDTVKVHPDFLERFDRLNVVQGQEPEPEPEPAKEQAPRSRSRRKTEE
jgi:hypothetical protein